MKTSLATTLSIVGVLASGAGAFAVNSYVLNSSSDSVYAAPTETAVTSPSGALSTEGSGGITSSAAQDLVIDTPTTNSQTDKKITGTTVGSTPISPVAAPVSAAQSTTYNVGESGRVTLEVRDGSLRVTSVTPNTGWSAKLPEYDDGEIEVEFYSGSLEVEFKARLVNGEVAVFVESEDESADDSYEREDHDDNYDDHEDDD